MPMPPAGHGLAVEDRQVDAAGVHVLDDDRLGGDLDVLQLGQVGVRPAAEREDDLLADVDVVAVDEHAQPRLPLPGVVGVAHGQKATESTATLPGGRGARSGWLGT